MIGLFLSALSSPILGQTLSQKSLVPPNDGVEGLSVNSTITVNGMAFFLNFLDFWREKPGSDKYSIEIGESLSRRLGNKVWVSFGQKRVFFSALPVQRDSIRPLSEQAADTTYAALIALSLPSEGGGDPDMDDDEI